MVNLTALQIARVAGVARFIRNEAVGTGNSSTTEFSLDQDRTIPDSETIYLAGTATTAYTINYDNGVITFTTAPGAVAITADYAYVKQEDLDIVEDDWDDHVDKAEAEAEKTFNKYYVTETTKTEWFDGNATVWRRDPLLDRGYVGGYENTDYANNRFKLNYAPVTKINHVYFITKASDLSKAYYYNGATYTDDTSEANTVGGTAFTILSTSSDYFYIGYQYRFEGLFFDIGTVSTGGGTLSAEYYNGSTWTSVTITDRTTKFTINSEILWTAPSDWAQTSVNSSSNYYWIRFKISSNFTIAPTAYQIYMNQDKILSYEVNRTDLDWNSEGRLIIWGYNVPDGFRNIRVDYSYGLRSGETAPDLYVEYASIIAAIRMFVSIMGGSYINITSFNLPEIGGTIGEAYVQNRETIKVLQERALEIRSKFGGRYVGSST